jgi:hypothetical protein
MTIITPLGSFMIIAFIVLGVVTSAASLAVLTEFVTSNRKVRLTRRQSVGTYYRGLAHLH